jgi:hypothetical protein
MAAILKNTVINNVGTVPIDVVETTASNRATVIGMSLTNLTQSFVYVDILIQDDTSITGYYLKETLLPANTSLRAVSTGEKLILAPSNKLLVRSSLNDSVDVVVSYAEIV